MAKYRVELERKGADGSRERDFRYVSAPDTQTGYRKAAEKAEAKLVKAGKLGFRAVSANCVG
jgi:hypothetical protein